MPIERGEQERRELPVRLGSERPQSRDFLLEPDSLSFRLGNSPLRPCLGLLLGARDSLVRSLPRLPQHRLRLVASILLNRGGGLFDLDQGACQQPPLLLEPVDLCSEG